MKAFNEQKKKRKYIEFLLLQYIHYHLILGIMIVCLMVFNATFNNISVISWRSVLLVEETGGPRENHRPVASQVSDKLYHIMLYTSPFLRFKPTTSVVICTDCIGCCKSNYHTITATTTSGCNDTTFSWYDPYHNWVSEWLLFKAKWAIFSYIMMRTSCIQWDGNDGPFVLCQPSL
jgi:hypothetical protein